MAPVNRRRLQFGDVIEIHTPKGLAYAQYTHRHDKPPKYGEMIRVLPGLFKKRPGSFASLVTKTERFNTFVPLGAMVRRKIVEIVANEVIPERCKAFPVFRSGNPHPKTGKIDVWWLWDGERSWEVGQLTDEMKKLSIEGCCNDTYLIECIVDGWSPEDYV